MQWHLLRCFSSISCMWNRSLNFKGWEPLLPLAVCPDKLVAQSEQGDATQCRQRQVLGHTEAAGWLKWWRFTISGAGLYPCNPGKSHHRPTEQSMNHRRWGARPLPRGQWEPIFPPGWGLHVLYAGLFCIGFLFSSPFLIHKNPLEHVDKGFTGTKDKRAYYGLVATQKVELRRRHFCGFGEGNICDIKKTNKSGGWGWGGTKRNATQNSFLTPLSLMRVIFVMS